MRLIYKIISVAKGYIVSTINFHANDSIKKSFANKSMDLLPLSLTILNIEFDPT